MDFDKLSREADIRKMVEIEVFMNATHLVEDLLKLKNPIGGVAEINIGNYPPDDELEILEWWFVSEWLYGRLRRANETVMECLYGYLWGRVTFGQEIALDGVIIDIAQGGYQ